MQYAFIITFTKKVSVLASNSESYGRNFRGG